MQCITCNKWVQLDIKSSGICSVSIQETDALRVNNCKDYLLGVMHSIKSRSSRKMIFDDKLNVRLE